MAPEILRSKVPMFFAEDYDDWKIRMQAHLSAMNDEMWSIIADMPIVIQKTNTSNDQTTNTEHLIPKLERNGPMRTKGEKTWIMLLRTLFIIHLIKLCLAKSTVQNCKGDFGKA
ncbi:hypothetical protein ACS0TY_029995 [Phlomoides rotata]